MGTSKKKSDKISFIVGICFLCGYPCKEGCYLHEVCAVAYDDEKKKKIKEIAEKERQEKNDKKNEEIKCQKEVFAND